MDDAKYIVDIIVLYDEDKLLSFVLFSLTEAMFSMPDDHEPARNNISHL